MRKPRPLYKTKYTVSGKKIYCLYLIKDGESFYLSAEFYKKMTSKRAKRLAKYFSELSKFMSKKGPKK